MSFGDRLKHAWNVFTSRDSPDKYSRTQVDVDIGYGSYDRADRMHFSRGNERSIATSVLTRIAMDCASISFAHVMLDDEGRYKEIKKTGLHSCLTLEANKDQTARAFIQDIVESMFDEGTVAVVPIDTDINADIYNSFDILTMRTAKIVQWYPNHVKVHLYNDEDGKYYDIVVEKKKVAIIDNPLYSIMNEQNSILQRAIRKLNLLDSIDEQSGSGKLDIIIQLPYTIKSDLQKQHAAERKQAIEEQLAGSKYGIAYIDGTEHITQLNRPAENNLMKQIEYLIDLFYSQLGITTDIMNGTADEKTMVNYNNRTIEPIVSAICDEFKRKFLTKTARTQGQSIMYFANPFKLAPIETLANSADKFTRNAIMSSNEFRQIMMLKPSSDPDADALRNKNLNKSKAEEASENTNTNTIPEERVERENQNG